MRYAFDDGALALLSQPGPQEMFFAEVAIKTFLEDDVRRAPSLVHPALSLPFPELVSL